ncbi:MAG: Hsp20 family protein [Opitutae bacterium]
MKINHQYQVNPEGSIFDSFLTPLFRKESNLSFLNSSVYHNAHNPVVKVSGEDSNMRVDVLVPGWSKNELELGYKDGFLFLSSNSNGEKVEQKKILASELDIRMEIPSGWDVPQASAKLADGILTIRIPRKAIEKPKSLKIT